MKLGPDNLLESHVFRLPQCVRATGSRRVCLRYVKSYLPPPSLSDRGLAGGVFKFSNLQEDPAPPLTRGANPYTNVYRYT